jgi:hypothetical protein
MKKTEIKSLIIGFLLATCIFLFMGNTFIEQKYGDILKVEIVKSSLPTSLDVKIKDFPYDKLRVDVVDMP